VDIGRGAVFLFGNLRIGTPKQKGFEAEQFVKAGMILKKLKKAEDRAVKRNEIPEDNRRFKGDKYPSEKSSKENKLALAEAFAKNSIFKAPVFSRYAFVLLKEVTTGLTLEKAVKAIIKWECHDYLVDGATDKKNAFDFFTEKIFDFLENLAPYMKTIGKVDAEIHSALMDSDIATPVNDWLSDGAITNEKLIQQCKDMIENASLCLLSKSPTGDTVSFEHDLFREYFLAQKFAKVNLREDEICRELFYLLSNQESFYYSLCKSTHCRRKVSRC
jgi:hypothetical protein